MLRWLNYFAVVIGLFALGLLIFGIIKALLEL